MKRASGGVVSAQEKKPHASKHAAKTAAKAAPMVGAEIVSVDAAKKTVSFKNDKGESVTWPVEGKALESLKTLKAGEKVTIGYSVDAKGAPKAALDIKAIAAAVPEKK